MLTTYFTRRTTLARYYAGPAGPHVDGFTHWLAQRGYQRKCIRQRLPGAVQLATWMQTQGYPLSALSPTLFGRFRQHLSQHHHLLLAIGLRTLSTGRLVGPFAEADASHLTFPTISNRPIG